MPPCYLVQLIFFIVITTLVFMYRLCSHFNNVSGTFQAKVIDIIPLKWNPHFKVMSFLHPKVHIVSYCQQHTAHTIRELNVSILVAICFDC